jgi:hypothetical protein
LGLNVQYFKAFVYFLLYEKYYYRNKWGIGYELALKFANAGHQVLAISRKTPRILIEHENISCLSVDLSMNQI